LKDENIDVIKQQSIDQETSYIEDGVSTLNEEKSANGEDTVSSTGTLNEESTQESSRELKVEEAVTDISPTKTGVIEAPSLAKTSTEDMINQIVDENATDNEKSNSSDIRSKGQPGPINVQTEKLVTTPPNAITSPTELQSPSKHSTWANLAASNSQKWGNSQLAEPKGRVVSPPLTRTQSTQSQQSNREQKDRTVNREFSLYVKGIIDGMSKTVLDKAFKTFGPVTNLDVVPTKSCAFVEFGTQEAYQQALTKKQIEIPNIGIVTVEERKQKNDDVGRSQGRHYGYRYNNPHNGINSQRGNRSGRNMASRPPAKS